MDADWCRQLVEDSIKNHGKPEIINSDQGSHFIGEVFTEFILNQSIQLRMDGYGYATDNIFIERLWRSMKYEKIYPNEYANGI